MPGRIARAATLVAAATLAGTPALAQSAAEPAPSPAPSPAPPRRAGAFFLSVGTDALGHDLGDATPGIAAHAGYERRIGGARSPFSLRVAGDYWRTGRSYTADLHDGNGPLDIRRTTTLVGGSVLGVLRLPTFGSVRPYALAGVGLQQYANRNESALIPTGVNTGWRVVYLPPVRVNAVSYTGGFGASARLGGLTPFVEARVTVLPGLGNLGVQQVRAPLTFGLRF